jgi:hypothetical protein
MGITSRQIYDVHLTKVSQIIFVRSIAKGTLVGGGLRISNLEAKQSTLGARRGYPPVC